MHLFELFDENPRDMIHEIRSSITDFLTPLAANGVPYVSMDAIIDKLRDLNTGIEIDKALVMQALDPNEAKMVTKLEGDRVYFQVPTPDRKVADEQAEREREDVSSTAAKQAKKEIAAR